MDSKHLNGSPTSTLRARLVSNRRESVVDWEGERLRVRELTAKQAETVFDVALSGKGEDDLGANLRSLRWAFALALVDDDGNRAFSDDEVDTVVAELPASLVTLVGETAMGMHSPGKTKAPSGRSRSK